MAEKAPLRLFDPTGGSASSESSRVMRKHDFIVWFTRLVDGWESLDEHGKNR